MSGDDEQALESLDKALQLDPACAEALNNKAVILQNQDKLDEAITSYEKAIQLEPGYLDAVANLGVALRLKGKNKQAVEVLCKATRLYPDDARIHNNLGNAWVDLLEFAEAENSYKRALEIQPDYAEAHNNLGSLYITIRDWDKARQSLSQAISISPDYPEALNNLGMVHAGVRDFDTAEHYYSQALKVDPEFTLALNNLGALYIELDRYEEARARFQCALAINSSYPEAHKNLGDLYRYTGELEKSRSEYSEAIRLNREYCDAHRALSALINYTQDQGHLDQMLTIESHSALSKADQAHLKFAIAKAYDDIGNYELAFDRYVQANGLRSAELCYQPALDRNLFAEIKRASSRLDSLPDVGCLTDYPCNKTPVFIIGMPRSGTTLLEQIIASHPRVYGAGELDWLDEAISRANWPNQSLTPDGLGDIRDYYCRRVESLGSSEAFVVDKMPMNFRWVCIIRKALPEARIIHISRDPRAICWSIYKNYFAAEGIGWAYELEHIANYYSLYQDLMAYCRKQHPGELIEIGYEDLTENQDDVSRKLISDLGLEWSDECLRFHERKNAVSTASAVQVRRKMYQGSSKDWEHYKSFLKGKFGENLSVS